MRRRSVAAIAKATAIAIIAVLIAIAGISVGVYYATLPPAVVEVPVVRPKLTVWGRATFAPAQIYWTNELIYKWAAENEVDVEITWLSVTDIGPKLTAAVEAGMPPDVVINGHPTARFAEAGLLLPLDDIVDKLGREDFYEIKLLQGIVDGKQYAIPTMFEITWITIRKDLFEKAGIMDLLPPKNFDELLEAAKKLTGVEPGVYGLGIPLGLKSMDAWWQFEHFWMGFGGGFMESRKPEGVVLGKEPYRTGLKKAFEWYIEAWEAGVTPPDSPEWADISNNLAYLEGKAAMIINPLSVWYAVMTGKPELVPKTVLAPVLPIAVDLGDESNFVFKATKHPELAKDLVYTFYADKEAYRKGFCEASHLYALPIFKSQMEVISEAWKAGKYPAMIVDPKEACEAVKYHETPLTWPLNEATSVYEAWREGFVFTEMIQRVVIKGEDIDAVIDEYQARAEEDVRKAYG
jgi:multiple sugar transport system substrate-binding protein